MSDLEDLEEMATADHPEPWRGRRGARDNHCSAGHEFTPENTRWYPYRGRRRRICKACCRMHSGFKNIYKPRKPKQCSSTAAGIAPAGGNQ